MARNRGTTRSLKRNAARRPERKTIIIFCEGQASEPDYINGLRKLDHVRRNTSFNVVIDPMTGVPLTLVEKAVAMKKLDDEVDEYWCVFDVEWPAHHPNLERAVRLAAENGIRLAVSNPCFELWLILHFQDSSAPLYTRSAESQSRTLDGRVGKRIDARLYMPNRKLACDRAAKLDARHRLNGTNFPKDNPSSGMYALLAAIEG